MISTRILTLLALLIAPAAALAQALTLAEGSGRQISLSRDAASVYVANPGVADVQAASNRTVFVTGVSPGTTNVIATDFDGNAIVSYDVRVVARNSDAARALGDGLSIEGGGNVAVIRGRAGDVDDAQTVPNVRDILQNNGRIVVDRSDYAGPNQITIRVRFVEASREDLRSVGLDISALETIGSDNFRIGTGIFNATAANALPSIGVRGISGDVTLETLLQALDSQNIVQILSEPTLTTVSGQEATFIAGGEIGYPVAQGDGVVTTEFKQYGVQLEFLPTILPDGRIAVNVAPEVSYLDPSATFETNGFAAPALSIRQANTTVEVGSGQTFAIAGLYQQFSTDERSGVPGISSILGRTQSRRQESELIIFVTTYLTDPTDVAEPRAPLVDIADTVGFITK